MGSRACLILLAGALTATASAEEAVKFNRDIRPILSDNCFACHGPDEKQRKAGLRLDTAEGAQALLKSGRQAVAPGNRGISEVYHRVATSDAAEKMPPPETERFLTPAQVELFGKWIDQGAPYEKHWAFVKPERPTTPPVQNANWPRNPVDQFILARMEEKGLAPNALASKEKLVRRAYLDLTGLLPQPEEVDAFLADTAPDAYDRLIDRLLESPHYGERWARHWLDVARFAESHGYEQDYNRDYAYYYRDFVICAFNADLPYDTFVQWQLAGDEIAPENPQALMATGFLAAGTHATQITKSQVEKERYDELDDMARTTGTAMLGLTIGCARCHDHKYDPISAVDYYRLLSTFTTTVRADVPLNVDPESYQQAKAAFDGEHQPLINALTVLERDVLPGRFDQWLTTAAQAPAPAWVLPGKLEAAASSDSKFTPLADGSYLVEGRNDKTDTYTITLHTALEEVKGLRIEALPDPALFKRGPGRAENGNFALSQVTLKVAPYSGGEAVDMPLQEPRATFEQPGFPVAGVLDADDKTAWAVDGKMGEPNAAAFTLAQPTAHPGGATLTVTLKFAVNDRHNLGRLRLSVSGTPAAVLEIPPAPEAAHLAFVKVTRGEALAESDHAALQAWHKYLDADWQTLHAQEQAHAKLAPAQPLAMVMISSEGVPAIRTHTQGGDYLQQTHFLNRGDPNQKGDVATQSFIRVLMEAPELEARWQEQPPPGSKLSYRRRALANWMTDFDYGAGHLMGRVAVNRIWQHHLGRGIVGTPSDFGFQGEWPSHPELLDYLVYFLRDNGWKLKPLHKLIMTSATYMQSADLHEEKLAVDSTNQLFWHYPRHRLEAEILRDAMLSASGALDPTLFGPGTLEQDHKRRSLYFMIKRSKLIPMMTIFDAPDATQGISERPRTTIAPQALLLMNNRSVRSWSESFASRINGPTAPDPINALQQAYRIALARPATPEEVADATTFLQTQTASYTTAGRADAQAQAWADLCQVLLGLNEFVYVD